MKARWKVLVVLAAASGLCAFLLWRSGDREQKALEETRRALRQQGFKIDLAEFNFSTSDELRARAAALTNTTQTIGVPRGVQYVRQYALLANRPDYLERVGASAAVVVWKQDQLRSPSGEDLWPALREMYEEMHASLDAAAEAARAGPIRFELNAGAGNAMLLPHLGWLKHLIQMLADRAILDLHDGNQEAAWKNVLAASRLVTAWEPEPVEISHLVRFNGATIAFNISWQALQSDGWADDRLAQLQREWESVDFFKGLPETAAFKRASMAATCQLERQQPIRPGVTWNDAIHSPRSAWHGLNEYWRRVRYRRHESYEDENALLLHFRDRELETRLAVNASSWSEMRQLPGVTNLILFQSKHRSSMQFLMNNRQLQMAWHMYAEGGEGRSWLGRAADAETRRRLIIAALALKRHQLRNGSYPNALQELAPELLKDPPGDFMDGKPLRYRRTDDGHFVLYSTGLDCIDNNGLMPRRGQPASPYQSPRQFRVAQGGDLVWPRPASTAEVEAFRREQVKARAARADRDEDLQAEEQWGRAARRQAGAEKLFEAKPKVRAAEPTFRGRPLSETLRNANTAGTNKFTLNELLTLRQVATGEEPETATFETPISYDVVTNLGTLQLYIDPSPDEDSDEGCVVGQLECRRAVNGNCLLVWRTIYESPGKHALQMGLDLNEPERDDELVVGPVAPFVVSNLCQFSLSSAYFHPEMGATLRAKLPELKGTYTVDLTSPAGDLLKTIKGSTSNGVIKVHWDLTDDKGRRCTNNEFGSIYHITLPDSGRWQKLKGP